MFCQEPKSFASDKRNAALIRPLLLLLFTVAWFACTAVLMFLLAFGAMRICRVLKTRQHLRQQNRENITNKNAKQNSETNIDSELNDNAENALFVEQTIIELNKEEVSHTSGIELLFKINQNKILIFRMNPK